MKLHKRDPKREGTRTRVNNDWRSIFNEVTKLLRQDSLTPEQRIVILHTANVMQEKFIEEIEKIK